MALVQILVVWAVYCLETGHKSTLRNKDQYGFLDVRCSIDETELNDMLPIKVDPLEVLLLDVVEVEGDVKVHQIVQFIFLPLRVQVGVDGTQVGLHYGHQVRQCVANLKERNKN